MIVSFRLGPNIACEQICSKVQELINYYNKNRIQLEDNLLVIQIKSPYDDHSHIPKLEYKNSELQ